jgi:arogenate/prephenate dehydratase
MGHHPGAGDGLFRLGPARPMVAREEERIVRIAFQGEMGAFGEAAAERVNREARRVGCPTFDSVFEAVGRGPATHGVLPIENSIAGTIHQTYDLLLEHDLSIVGEVEVPVVHHLLAPPGVSLDRVRRIYSHPQALAQCERFLKTLSDVEIVASANTAGAAKRVAEEARPDAAAIASARAGDLFGLVSLAPAIQDFRDNVTRFIVIGRRPLADSMADKTTVVFSLRNEPGALFKALGVFALRNVNLTKLESRPFRGRPWEYLFYADLAAARDELPCARALQHLAEMAPTLRVLGSYCAWHEHEMKALDPFDVCT